jgi:succinate dehydrogenase / fumarate reductase, iron-sulfur subunit
MPNATFRIWRGKEGGGAFKDHATEVGEGMVVLDVVLQIQAEQANDLAVRWNCKAGKCGSCSAEINGKPRLMCMTRCSDIDLSQPVTVEPMKTFPHLKDLVTDVSFNYEAKKRVQKFQPRSADNPDGTWKVRQDVCHVLREHDKFADFIGPRMLVHTAYLEMHPLDTGDRRTSLRDEHGIGYCNITKCCTTVCPEGIKITDNAIIPLKERVVDKFYDPVLILARKLLGRK